MAISASRTTRFGVAGGIAVPAGDFSAKQELNQLSFDNNAFDESNAFSTAAWSITDSSDVSISVGVDALTITTHAANIGPVRATTQALAITTYPATIVGGGVDVSATTDTLVIAGNATTVESAAATVVGVTTQALTVTTYPVSIGVEITGTDDVLVITENKAGVDLNIIPTPASLTIAPQVATVEAIPGVGTEIGPTTDTLTITTHRAAVDLNIIPTPAALSITTNRAVIGQTYPDLIQEWAQGGAKGWTDQAARRKHNQRVMDDDAEFMEMAKAALPELIKHLQGR